MVYSIHMKQTLMKDTVCGDQRFRSCAVENSKCVNCGKLFIELLKKGDWLKYKCWSCKEMKDIKIQYIWSKSQVEGRCQECMDMDKVISPLWEGFVDACEIHHEKGNDEVTTIEEKALNKIVALPKEQLKEFLRRMNSGIER